MFGITNSNKTNSTVQSTTSTTKSSNTTFDTEKEKANQKVL